MSKYYLNIFVSLCYLVLFLFTEEIFILNLSQLLVKIKVRIKLINDE